MRVGTGILFIPVIQLRGVKGTRLCFRKKSENIIEAGFKNAWKFIPVGLLCCLETERSIKDIINSCVCLIRGVCKEKVDGLESGETAYYIDIYNL